jgi:protein Mpv17
MAATLLLFSCISVPCHALQVATPLASTAWTWYTSMLATRPLLTKSLTSSCIMSVSDVMCQELVQRALPTASTKNLSTATLSSLDSNRTLQVAITGFIWSGPVTHFWYGLLERIYAYVAQLFSIQSPAVALCVKLLLDAILFSPTVVTGYFIVRSFLEGGDWVKSSQDKLRTKFKPTLFSAWRFWPAVNSVNFYFVPLPFRVLYMNVLSLLWSGYLTHVNSAQSAPKKKRK